MRVWVPACATGEEAYSIAMLLCEHARTLDAPPRCRSSRPTSTRTRSAPRAKASIRRRSRPTFPRSGCGASSSRSAAATGVGASCARWCCSPLHDLLKDSPFSRLDLVSCRNLFIYLEPRGAARAFEILHFALRPRRAPVPRRRRKPSTSTRTCFAVVDKKHRIYEQRPSASGTAAGAGRHQRPRAIAGSCMEKSRRTAHGLPNHRLARCLLPARRLRAGHWRHRHRLWRELHLQADRALRAAVARRQRRLRHRPPVGQRRTLPAVRRRRADAQPAALVHPMLRLDLRAALFTRDAVESARRCVARADRARRRRRGGR